MDEHEKCAEVYALRDEVARLRAALAGLMKDAHQWTDGCGCCASMSLDETEAFKIALAEMAQKEDDK